MFFLGTVGPMELLVVGVIIVFLFGAKKLPELGKSIGEGIKNFKRSITSRDKDEDNPPDEPHPPKKDE